MLTSREMPALLQNVETGLLNFQQEKNTMNPSTNDQIEGTIHELKGKVKEKVGQLTNDPDLTTEGQIEKVGGIVQKKVGQIEKVLEK